MSFFKKYNGTSNRRLARLETLVWTLIYGGLLAIVVSLFIPPEAQDTESVLLIAGGIATVAGILLLLLRARLREDH